MSGFKFSVQPCKAKQKKGKKPHSEAVKKVQKNTSGFATPFI